MLQTIEDKEQMKALSRLLYREVILLNLIFVSPCIIDINNINNQLDATIMAY